jgi:hypothetical protein
MRNTIAILAAVITFLSILPYIRDILRGTTHPNIVSWFTWTLITAIATAAAFSDHEYKSGILTLAGTLATAVVVILGVKKYSRFDVMCQGLALAGLIWWQVTNDAGFAIALGIITDFIASLPTFRHSWRQPYEETWQTFGISSFAAALTVLSLNSFTLVSLGFPVYLTLVNIALFTNILLRRRLKVA